MEAFRSFYKTVRKNGPICALIVVMMACSSVDKVALNSGLDLQAPRFQTYLLAGKTADKADYKLRQGRSNRVVLGLIVNQPKDSQNDQKLASQLELLLHHSLSKNGIQIVPVSQDQWQAIQDKTLEKVYASFQENQLDAILVAGLESASNQTGLELSLWDPVFGEKTAQLNSDLRVHFENISTENQAELFIKKSDYRFLNTAAAKVLVLPSAFDNDLATLVMNSVQGTIDIKASVSDVQVSLIASDKTLALGKPPFSEFKADEGNYKLLVKRKGYDDKLLKFNVRAGKKIEHYISYPDSVSTTSISVLSAPAGQRLSIDGSVVGETPHFITGLAPGSYNLELSRQEQDKYIVTAHGSLEINPGVSAERLLLTSYKTTFGSDFIANDYFRLTSTPGQISLDNASPGLRFFSKDQIQAGSWVGLVSHPLVLNDFSATLSIEENPQQIVSFGIVSGTQDQNKPRILLNLENGVYTLLQYKNDKLIAPLNSYVTKNKESSIHKLNFEFEKEESILTIRIDGTKIFSMPYPELFDKQSSRIVILTRAQKADGSLIAHEFNMFSGPGLSEEK